MSTAVAGPAAGERIEKLEAARGRAQASRLAAAGRAVLLFCRRKPLGALGGAIVVNMLVLAIGAEVIAPYQYDETVAGARMKPPGGQFATSPALFSPRRV